MSRMIRWVGFSDLAAARGSIDELVSRPFENLIVGHGTPIKGRAREAVAGAFDWLSQARR
jgi:hypothetical protein